MEHQSTGRSSARSATDFSGMLSRLATLKTRVQGRDCSSVTEHMLGMQKVAVSISDPFHVLMQCDDSGRVAFIPVRNEQASDQTALPPPRKLSSQTLPAWPHESPLSPL